MIIYLPSSSDVRYVYVKYANIFLFIWITLTTCVSILDLCIGILFGLDYGIFRVRDFKRSFEICLLTRSLLDRRFRGRTRRDFSPNGPRRPTGRPSCCWRHDGRRFQGLPLVDRQRIPGRLFLHPNPRDHRPQSHH